MSTSNLLEVLNKLIREFFFQCEWAIEWEERQHFIDLTFQFTLLNPNRKSFSDDSGEKLNLSHLPYEIGVTFYNSNEVAIDETHQIISIPISGTQGIPYGELVSMIKYLKMLTSTVHLQWTEFLNDPLQTEFSIEWQQEEFEGIRHTLIDSHRYSQTKVFFPREYKS